MAVETSVLDFVLKFVIGLLVAILGWTAKKLDKRVDELEEKSEDLEKKLIKEYYDKEEIKSNIYEPLSTDIKETRSEGGDLYLVGVQRDVSKVLTLSGFTSILKIFPDIETAITEFSQS